MPRVRKGAARTQKRKRVLRQARGYRGVRSRHYYQAEIAILRAGRFAYRHRRQLKRDMRRLWIVRITAACKMRGTRYSRFMNGLKLAGVTLNRKMLSQIAIDDPKAFDQLVEIAEQHTNAMAKSPATA